MLHTKRQTRRACLLLALCVASLYVSSSEARSDPSLFWATVAVTTTPSIAPSETPTMAPVATSSAPVAGLTPTAAPEVTATPVESTAPAIDSTPAPPPSLAPPSTPVNDSPTSAPVIDAPALSVDGGPITTATDPEKDFGPMTGGGTRPISPPSVPAPAPTPKTPETLVPAPAANGIPTPPTESVIPVTDPALAPVAETEAPSEAPVDETEAPAPSGPAIDPEKDFGPMTGGGTRPTSPPVVTPAPTLETSATIAETQAPPADTVAPSTDPVPDSVAESSAPSEAPTSDEMVVDTGSLPPLETDPAVDTSDDGVANGAVENEDPEPAIDESVDMAPVIADTEDTLDTSETETEDGQETEIEDGQVEETLAPPAAESSAVEPLPPANTPEPQSSSNFIIRAPAPQILPPPQVVTGTASDGSLTSTVIFNGANILTPHS